MRLTYTTSVFDNDHTGTNGRGTGFQLSIKPDIRSKFPPVVLQYRLLDLLDGSFNPESQLRAYKDEQAEFDRIDAKSKQEQVAILPITDGVVISMLMDIIHNTPDAVTGYRSGNQKALNMLIGLVMKHHKQLNPAAVKLFFEQQLAHS